MKVAGDAGFNASTGLGAVTLTTFDASGVTATGAAGAVTLTTGALTSVATLTGGAGTNVIDAALATKAVTITGGAGADTLTGGAGADTIIGGNGTNILSGGAGADTITSGTGADTITGGTGADVLTGGTGADTFVFTAAAGISTATSMDVIKDLGVALTGGDTIQLANKGTEVGVSVGGALTATKSDVSIAGTLLEALNLVSTGDGGTNGIVKWFQFNGNTYLVEDMSASTTFVDGTDQVIQIQGLVDLLTLSAGSLNVTFA